MAKIKYFIYSDEGYDDNGKHIMKAVFANKHEEDAVRFLNNLSNVRQYGQLRLFKKDNNGYSEWDERHGEWNRTEEI